MADESNSIMKRLLLSSSPACTSKILPDYPHKEITRKDDVCGPKLSTHIQSMLGHPETMINTVELDHSYARPTNTRPDNTYAKPIKTLFFSRQSKPQILNSRSMIDDDVYIDIESDSGSPNPSYDVPKARHLMEECEKNIAAIRADPGDPEWDLKLDRSTWTGSQCRLFERACRYLNFDRLSRNACVNSWNEPVLRRIIVNKSARRFRTLYSTTGPWDLKAIQWLHNVFMENMDAVYLSAYVDILQTLKKKIPQLLDRILANSTSTKYNPDILNALLKRPWDPCAVGFSCYNPRKLPGNPVIVMVPNGVGYSTNTRTQKWFTLFSQVGSVVAIEMPYGGAPSKASIASYLDQMMNATKNKLNELKSDIGNRPIVLVGCNSGAALACQAACLDRVAAVICLGFPYNTIDDCRGEATDVLLDIQVPILFVIGQNANMTTIEDMEELREKLTVETGLVVVGGGDDQLRVCKSRQAADGISQSMVDRCILDEVSDFLGQLLASPLRSFSFSNNESRPRIKYVERKRKLPEDSFSKKTLGMGSSGIRTSFSTSAMLKKPRVSKPRPSNKKLTMTGLRRPVGRPPGAPPLKNTFFGGRPIGRVLSSRPPFDSPNSLHGGEVLDTSLNSPIKNVPEIRVVGSEDCGPDADRSLMEALTPDRLLQMPIVLAPEDGSQDTSLKMMKEDLLPYLPKCPFPPSPQSPTSPPFNLDLLVPNPAKPKIHVPATKLTLSDHPLD